LILAPKIEMQYLTRNQPDPAFCGAGYYIRYAEKKKKTMKKAITFTLLIILTLSITSCDNQNKSPKIEQRHLSISNGTFVVDGEQLLLPTLEKVFKILGKPNRVYKKINTIYVWDQLGILGYTKPGDNTIFSITIELVNRDFEFSPKNSYLKDVIINSHSITHKSNRSDLKKSQLIQDKMMTFLYSQETEKYTIIADFDNGVQDISIDWNKN